MKKQNLWIFQFLKKAILTKFNWNIFGENLHLEKTGNNGQNFPVLNNDRFIVMIRAGFLQKVRIKHSQKTTKVETSARETSAARNEESTEIKLPWRIGCYQCAAPPTAPRRFCHRKVVRQQWKWIATAADACHLLAKEKRWTNRVCVSRENPTISMACFKRSNSKVQSKPFISP